MSNTLFTLLTNGTSLLDEATIDGQIGALDAFLSRHGNNLSWATARAPVTQNGTTVEFPDLDVFHYALSTADLGKLIRQRIAATTVAVPNGNALVATISDTDGANLSAPTAVDIDALPTVLKDSTKVVLLVRSPAASGTGLLHYVALRAPQRLNGTGTITASAATTVVNFPTGYTMPSARYVVLFSGTAAGFWPKDPVVTTKATGSFTITHVNAAGAPTFDYVVEPL